MRESTDVIAFVVPYGRPDDACSCIDMDRSRVPKPRKLDSNRIVGIVISILLAPLLYWAAVTVMANRAENAATQIQTNAHAALERFQARQLQFSEERRDRGERERLEQLAAQQNAAREEWQRHELGRLKQEAWSRIYPAAAACDKPPTWEFQVECGNRFMRARRDFETKWSQGAIDVGALVARQPPREERR